MSNYRTFNVIAGILVLAFPAFIWVILEKTDSNVKPAVNAASAAADARRVEVSEKTTSQALLCDDLLAALQIDSIRQQPQSAEPISLYGAAEKLSSQDDIGTETLQNPVSPVNTSMSSPATTSNSAADRSSSSASDGNGITGFSGSTSGNSSLSSGISGGIAGSSVSAGSTSSANQPAALTGIGGGTSHISFSEDVSVVVLSGDQKLLQDDLSAPGSAEAEIFCAKNETEAFQIIVTNKSNYTLPDIEIHVSDWQGSGLKKPVLTLFREHYVQVDQPSYTLESAPGGYPDALIPFIDPYTDQEITSGLYRANHISVAGKTNQGYWADVRVDSDVHAGDYTCSILVTSSNQQIAEIPVSLTVWDFSLPGQRQFITWYYGFYNIHQYYGLTRDSGSYYETLMERYRDMAYEHGVYPVYQSGGRDYNEQNGTVIFTPIYYQNINKFIEKYGKGILLIPTGWLVVDWDLKSDSMILNTLNSYNNMIKAHLDQNGNCQHGQYVVYLDEPYKPERIAAVKKMKDLMNTIPDLHIKMMLTGCRYVYDILDSQGHRCADLWVCYGQEVVDLHTRKPTEYQSLVNLSSSFLHDTNNSDAVLWTTAGIPRMDAALLTYRDFSWYGYTLGMTGGFGWKLTISSTDRIDPWVQSRTYINPNNTNLVYNGLGSHIYPGNSNRVGFSGIGGPIATMRLKMWRRACQDFEYFKILEGLTDKATVDAIVSGVVQDYSTYADSGTYLAARKEMARRILEYQ